jgi:hypothetical protein
VRECTDDGLLVHGSPQSSRWRAGDEANSVQIFGSVASSRSRLNVAVRNPRQPHCNAATGRRRWPNRLAGGENPVSGPREKWATQQPRAARLWHRLEQGLAVASALQAGKTPAGMPNIRPRAPRYRRARPWRPRSIPASRASP